MGRVGATSDDYFKRIFESGKSNIRFCSQHFKPSDFTNTGRLKKDVLPMSYLTSGGGGRKYSYVGRKGRFPAVATGRMNILLRKRHKKMIPTTPDASTKSSTSDPLPVSVHELRSTRIGLLETSVAKTYGLDVTKPEHAAAVGRIVGAIKKEKKYQHIIADLQRQHVEDEEKLKDYAKAFAQLQNRSLHKSMISWANHNRPYKKHFFEALTGFHFSELNNIILALDATHEIATESLTKNGHHVEDPIARIENRKKTKKANSFDLWQDSMIATFMYFKISSEALVAEIWNVHPSTLSRHAMLWIDFLCLWGAYFTPRLSVEENRLMTGEDMYEETGLFNVRDIVDCCEIKVEDNRQFRAQHHQLHSQHHEGPNIKIFTAVATSYCLQFVSDGVGASMHDDTLLHQCGYLDKLEPGENFLCDRGFGEDLTMLQKLVTAITPTKYHDGKQFGAEEVLASMYVGKYRILVEQFNESIREWRWLDSRPEHSQRDIVAKVFAAKGWLQGFRKPKGGVHASMGSESFFETYSKIISDKRRV